MFHQFHNTTNNISDNDNYKYVEEFLELNLYFWKIHFWSI